MKKRGLLFALSIACITSFGFAGVACDNNETETPSTPTSITISGPRTVRVGATIPLTTNTTEPLSWLSSDSSVATVDLNGVVTGVSAGKVTITASLLSDSNVKGTLEIEVRGNNATGISIVLDTNQNENIYQSEDRTYNIPAGQTFRVSYSLSPNDASKPSSIAFAFPDEEGLGSIAQIEYSDDMTYADITTTKTFEKFLLTLTAYYEASATNSLRTSITVTSYDLNEEKFAEAQETITNINDAEANLLTATITTTSNSLTSTDTFQVYENSTYHQNTSNGVTTSTYAGLDQNNNKFYYFSYDETTGNFETLYDSSTYTDLESIKTKASRPHFYYDYTAHYGLANAKLLSMITSDAYQGNVAFGNFDVRSNTIFTFNDRSMNLTSNFADYINQEQNCTLTLNIEYDSNYELKSYKYTYSENETIIYQEVGSDFTYGTKTPDEETMDLNKYYIDSFTMKCISGTSGDGYDFTNTTKYGGALSNEVSIDDEGRTVYTVPYSKSIPLQVSDFAPTTASFQFDPIVGTRNFEDQTVTTDRTLTSHPINGIVTINAPQNIDGNYIATTETITFSSQGSNENNFTYQIVINWTKTTLESIIIDTTAANLINTNQFPDIFLNGHTSYFWLNTEPDDLTYTYFIDIISGPENGLNLVKIVYKEGSDTVDYDYPEGSYILTANSVGSYTFRFGIVGYELNEALYTGTYTLNVLDLLTPQEIEENIVGETFTYHIGTNNFEVEFINDTIFNLTAKDNLGETITEQVEYKLADGRIYLEKRRTFQNENFYFDALHEGDILFDKDFTNIQLNLRIRPSKGDESNPDDNEFLFSYYTFTKDVDVTSLNGRSVNIDFYDGSRKSANITFNETDARAVITNYDGSVLDNLTFNYTYQYNPELYNPITISNVVSQNNYITNISIQPYGTSGNQYRATFTINKGSYTTTSLGDFTL